MAIIQFFHAGIIYLNDNQAIEAAGHAIADHHADSKEFCIFAKSDLPNKQKTYFRWSLILKAKINTCVRNETVYWFTKYFNFYVQWSCWALLHITDYSGKRNRSSPGFEPRPLHLFVNLMGGLYHHR